MAHELPPYSPPWQHRGGVAAAAAPLLVLLGFTPLVLKLIDVSTGLALFVACTVWLVHEMHGFQASTDRHNASTPSATCAGAAAKRCWPWPVRRARPNRRVSS